MEYKHLREQKRPLVTGYVRGGNLYIKIVPREQKHIDINEDEIDRRKLPRGRKCLTYNKSDLWDIIASLGEYSKELESLTKNELCDLLHNILHKNDLME